MRESDLEQLYARLEKPVYNVVYRRVWNADEAQEIVQEAFVRLWRMRDRVEPESADPLLYRIALNLAVSRLRSRNVWRWVSLEALRGRGTATDAEQDLLRDEKHAVVRDALDALPEELRRVVLLCEISDLTYEEIGETLGIAPGTVGSRRHRALKLLRRRLKPRMEKGDRTVHGPV
jgi:RNA polymerase sigma-70 factor (ECF subfamily)